MHQVTHNKRKGLWIINRHGIITRTWNAIAACVKTHVKALYRGRMNIQTWHIKLMLPLYDFFFIISLICAFIYVN